MPRSDPAVREPTDYTELEQQLLDVVQGVIAGAREAGSMVQEGGKPFHRVGCECELCLGVRLLAYAEHGGRCVLCGCMDDDACEAGCGWADADHFVCTAHPKAAITAAVKLARREAPQVLGGRRG